MIVGPDPQFEYWAIVGVVAFIVAIFCVGFFGWPKGGDPRKGSGNPWGGSDSL